jgi:hypothetical protein
MGRWVQSHRLISDSQVDFTLILGFIASDVDRILAYPRAVKRANIHRRNARDLRRVFPKT